MRVRLIRHADSVANVGLCLKALTTKRHTVAVADYFSTPEKDEATSLDAGDEQRVAKALGTAEFAWLILAAKRWTRLIKVFEPRFFSL